MVGIVAPALVGNPHTAGRHEFLDRVGTYQPQLIASGNPATTTEAVGFWHLRGQLCTGWFRFTITVPGTGAYSVTLPFTLNEALMDFGTSNNSAHNIVGEGRWRSSTSSESNLVILQLGTLTRCRPVRNAVNGILTGEAGSWERAAGTFRYLVDPQALGVVTGDGT